MARRLLLAAEALALMALLGLAYVIYGRFCANIPSAVAIMYLMLFSVLGCGLEMLFIRLRNPAEVGTEYPPAMDRRIQSLVFELRTVFHNFRALGLLLVTGVLYYLYWLVLFSIVKMEGVFVVLILLQLPLVLGPIALIFFFKENGRSLKILFCFWLAFFSFSSGL